MPALGIDRADQFRQGSVSPASDFLQPLPECIFETNARLVASDHDRALDDQRFHEDPPQSSPDLDQNISFLGRDARPNASAQPWTRTSQWMPMLQRGVFLGAPTPNQTLDS